ncbi:hypothetical protein CVIRNUC_010842 [Coccomyxa viridis]|uniref:Rhodanese domain-containing protein n=1 Tax=Coccomyxa viridis TaxID=1274662 RepID=A0AAV1IMY1_9CHLO|nr:hypothetical protein CVIRNUC_010842 [Coccomyxa viridis]
MLCAHLQCRLLAHENIVRPCNSDIRYRSCYRRRGCKHSIIVIILVNECAGIGPGATVAMRYILQGVTSLQRHYRSVAVLQRATISQATVRAQAWPVAAVLQSRPAFREGLAPTGHVNRMLASSTSQSRRVQAAAGGAGMGSIEELHPRDLQEILERVSQGAADDVQLIDVREDYEHQTASLAGFKLMPMSKLQEWAQSVHEDMDPDKETVLLCHHGVRSMRVAGFLAAQGFQKLRNVTGGIDAYSREVDSSVPLY